MKNKWLKAAGLAFLLMGVFALYSYSKPTKNQVSIHEKKDMSGPLYSIKVQVKGLRNSQGLLQFTLYDTNGSIPDEDYTQYYQQETNEISNGSATLTFSNLPEGKYAINILHDENKNGQIDKGFMLPIEGIGFSNFNSIGLMNRPNFKKASFYVNEDVTKTIKIIYM